MSSNVLKLSMLLFFNMSIIVSQEVCETKEETLEDLNSITKCTVDKTEETDASGKKSKKLSVKVSTSTRFLKRRVKKKEVSALGGSIATSGLESTSHNSTMDNSLSLEENSIDNIQKFKEKLSKDQLKNAYEFENVDQIPLFKSCKNKSKSENSDCFNEKMMAHIQKHFRYPQEALLNKIQGNVWVRFIIDEEGNITNLKSLGPKKGDALKHEAERVISKLTSFKPAVNEGENVLTKYGFPINFSLED